MAKMQEILETNMQSIIRKQKVSDEKLARAKELRKNMTQAERILWDYLRGNRLYGLHFRRHQVIDGYIVDFYCHSAGLVIEVDGEIHNNQKEEDLERERILKDRGLRILRIENEAIRNDLENVLAKIWSSAGSFRQT